MQIPLSGCQTPGGEEGVPGAQGVHVLRAAWALGGAGMGPGREPPAARCGCSEKRGSDEGFMQGHELGVGDALGGASLGDTRRGGKKLFF